MNVEPNACLQSGRWRGGSVFTPPAALKPPSRSSGGAAGWRERAGCAVRARAISRAHQLLASLKKGDKIRKPRKRRCGVRAARAAGLCVLLRFTWLLLPLPSREKEPTLERSSQEAAVLSTTCCPGKLRGLFSPGRTCRTLCWFQGQGQVLATHKPGGIAASPLAIPPRVSAAPRGTREEKPRWVFQRRWHMCVGRLPRAGQARGLDGQLRTVAPWPPQPWPSRGRPAGVAFQENPWGRGMAGILEAGWWWRWCQAGRQAGSQRCPRTRSPWCPGSGPAAAVMRQLRSPLLPGDNQALRETPKHRQEQVFSPPREWFWALGTDWGCQPAPQIGRAHV